MKTQNMNRDWIATARTLSQALPYLQRYEGSTVVIKLGGHAMGSDEAMEDFARDIVLMQQVGVKPVIVHGGGPMINELLERLEIKSEFVDGKRVTDEQTVEVVEMVLSGRVNKRIVQAINRQGGRAVGISGKDANLMICEQTDAKLGFVGTPDRVNPAIIEDLGEQGLIPVIAPLGVARRSLAVAHGCIGCQRRVRRSADVAQLRENRRTDGRGRHRGWHDPENTDRARRAQRGCARCRDS